MSLKIGQHALIRGRLVWGICFAFLLLSSPALIGDLLTIRNGIEQSNGAEVWYAGEVERELLRFKLLLAEAEVAPTASTKDDILLQLDLVFSRFNTLPPAKSNEWYTHGIRGLPEVQLIRKEIETIDSAVPLLDGNLPGFIGRALPHVENALHLSRDLSIKAMQEQNLLAGGIQGMVGTFQHKLMLYGAGFAVLMIGLAYLMHGHIRSERVALLANEQLKEMAAGLGRARDDAVEASRAKGRFLANASHELRTPLNGIIGFSELLRAGYTGALNAKQQEYIDDIHGSARRLLELINDILDLSKLEAGKQSLAEEVVSLEDIVRRAVHDMRETIRKARIDVGVEVETPLPAIRADPAKLRQVVDNLLSNAVKFTLAGGTVRLGLSRGNDGGLRLAVADTGVGIDSDELPKVFNAFEQVDSAYARQYKGTGLGLPLAKGFVELHGGTLALSSQPGVGTTITVRFPADRSVPQAASGRTQAVVDLPRTAGARQLRR